MHYFNVLSKATQDDIIGRTEQFVGGKNKQMEFIIDTVDLEEIRDAVD